jgi:uncharacterized protein YehS (DUF1456 family)
MAEAGKIKGGNSYLCSMLTNNDILKKIRIALELRDDDIIGILKLADYTISKGELSAIFRKEGHPNYEPCGDQLLRNFLNGLIIHQRGPFPPGAKKEGGPKKE